MVLARRLARRRRTADRGRDLMPTFDCPRPAVTSAEKRLPGRLPHHHDSTHQENTA